MFFRSKVDQDIIIKTRTTLSNYLLKTLIIKHIKVVGALVNWICLYGKLDFSAFFSAIVVLPSLSSYSSSVLEATFSRPPKGIGEASFFATVFSFSKTRTTCRAVFSKEG